MYARKDSNPQPPEPKSGSSLENEGWGTLSTEAQKLNEEKAEINVYDLRHRIDERFMADLVRQIKLPLVVDFMTVSSYGDGTVSTGDVKVVMDLDESIEGKDILMVEDIIDTGNTFNKVLGLIRHRKPRSLRICTFLSKPSRRRIEVPIDFCGIEIPDEFVCGYGLDFSQKYRNLPYVGVLSPTMTG